MAASEPSTSNQPRVIRASEVQHVLWGDEQSGLVKDWIYIRQGQLIAIIIGMPPGTDFRSSDKFRAIYDSHECQYVLTGEYTLQDPVTGEVRVAREGDAFVFGPEQWMHGYNFGETEMLSYEVLIRPEEHVGKFPQLDRKLPVETDTPVQPEHLGAWPPRVHAGHDNIRVVSRRDALYAILGDAHPLRAEIVMSTDRLTTGWIEIGPAARSDQIVHPHEGIVFVESGTVHVDLPEAGGIHELHAHDAFYLPAATPYRYLNFSGARTRVIFAVTGPEL